jgi:DNA-binding transcriptional ArsR family regulator
MAKHQNDVEDVAAVAAALGEPKRLLALGMLASGELCLCDLTEGLELSASTVSTHMAVLKRAGLVESRKDGRWAHFRLAADGASPLVGSALAWTLEHLPKSAKKKPVCSSRKDCCP